MIKDKLHKPWSMRLPTDIEITIKIITQSLGMSFIGLVSMQTRFRSMRLAYGIAITKIIIT